MPPKRKSSYHSTANKIRLIRGGKDYFDLLIRLINNAESIIHLQTYIFEEDETGLKVADALIAASLRGVNVYLLVDGYASQHLTSSFMIRMRRVGVKFRMFNRIFSLRHFYFGRRLHHKVFVADAHYALVGGINISDRYNDTSAGFAWLDWAVCIEGELSYALHRICGKRMLSRFRGRKKILSAPVILHDTRGTCEARVRINDWVRGKRQITTSYIDMIRKSKTDLLMVSSYFLPGFQMRTAIKRAIKRKIRVRVVLANISDVRIAKFAERYLYEWFLRNSVEIYEYQPNVLHAKISVSDFSRVTVGSYNLNNISAYASIELNIEVFNERFGKHAEAVLSEIIEKDCIRITPEYLKSSTSVFSRFINRLSYNIVQGLFFFFTFYFRPIRKH